MNTYKVRYRNKGTIAPVLVKCIKADFFMEMESGFYFYTGISYYHPEWGISYYHPECKFVFFVSTKCLIHIELEN
jgi:hypothetical protein